jgi:hypothetical protein
LMDFSRCTAEAVVAEHSRETRVTVEF